MWQGRGPCQQGGGTHIEAPDAGSCLASPDHLCQHPHLLDLCRHLLRIRELLEKSGSSTMLWNGDGPDGLDHPGFGQWCGWMAVPPREPGT